jgi:NAD+ diphosphatase
MLGFTAQATTERIQVSQDDLEPAKWFSRAELASFSIYKVSAQKQAEGFKMVSNDSISSHLLTAWKNKTIGVY